MKFNKQKYITNYYKSGTWHFKVRVSKNTRTFSSSKYGTEQNAYLSAISYRDNLIKGIVKTNTPSLLSVYYESLELFPIRKETARKHIISLKTHIKDVNKPIGDITKKDILVSLNSLIMKCSDDTICRCLSVWKRIFRTAVIKDYINVDLTQGIVSPKSQTITKIKNRNVTISREGFDAILAKIQNSRFDSRQLVTALEIMWYTGIRPAECFALTKENISNGYITINKELGSDIALGNDIDREIVIRKCKTKASVRKIPIPEKLQVILDNYESDEILFLNRYGQYYNLNNLSSFFKKYNFNMYQLRHSLASKLVTNNVDERTIIEILGHEKFDMSVYYARSNDELKRKALE